ncbi:MAG: radical SAM protein [Thermoplasmataceae archaeon]
MILNEALQNVVDRNPWVPGLLFIETTTACEYACLHCRAVSQPEPSPDDLSTDELKEVLDQISGMEPSQPHLIFTGGNLLLRSDIQELISYASESGIPFSLSPAASERLTEDFLLFARQKGARSVSLSLDGSQESTHDRFRSMAGSYRLTIQLIRRIIEAGLKPQVNTTVHRGNVRELPGILKLLHGIGVNTWELFFLIKTGRGVSVEDVTPSEYMQTIRWLSWIRGYGINIRTVEGPLVRVIDRIPEEPSETEGSLLMYLKNMALDLLGKPQNAVGEKLPHHEQGTKFTGTLFISHNGDVYPSGLFNFPLGNVRREKLEGVISRNAEMLDFRNYGKLNGKCGTCEFGKICGGSRARAFAYSGDPYGSDPLCTYMPKIASMGAV